MNEKVFSIASKFYEARTRVREILGDQFRPVIQKYMDAIKKLGANNNLSTLDSAKVCIQFSLQDQDAIGAMKFMAACVEIIEPSNTAMDGNPSNKVMDGNQSKQVAP